MKSMIFAAGLGTRLKPLTDTMPKALVHVGDRPLLDITIDRLLAAGATEIVVNVHHFGSQIIDHIASRSYPVAVRVSDERNELLDTGGGLHKAAALFSDTDEPILIHNVDILHNADLAHFYESSREEAVSLLVSSRTTSRYLLFDDDNCLMGWTNVATGEVRSPHAGLDISRLHRYAFSGIHTFSPRLFEYMKSWPAKFPIMDFYLSICDKVKVKAFLKPDLRLLDVGKQSTLSDAEHFVETIGG